VHGRALRRIFLGENKVAASAARTAILLDPHPLWLDVVEHALERVGVKVRGTATEPEQALMLVSEHNPDLFVAELAVCHGRLTAVEAIRSARESAPAVRVIVLSSVSDPGQIDRAFDAGVIAYVVKTAQAEDFASAVRQAFEHTVFFPVRAGSAETSAAPAPEDAGPLTKREVEILRLVAEGHTNAHMARTLWVTEQTVKFHLSNIYGKLDVANRTEAARWAQLHGLLPAEPRQT
jgi:NarL family two-component system response regulator LiaR